MRVYLAAPWVHKADAVLAKKALIGLGFLVVSTWTEWPDISKSYELEQNALSDWDEMVSADVLVLLNLCKSDGKATEMGGALALGKRVIVVGPREGNIFYHLPQVEHAESLVEAATLLGAV